MVLDQLLIVGVSHCLEIKLYFELQLPCLLHGKVYEIQCSANTSPIKELQIGWPLKGTEALLSVATLLTDEVHYPENLTRSRLPPQWQCRRPR